MQKIKKPFTSEGLLLNVLFVKTNKLHHDKQKITYR